MISKRIALAALALAVTAGVGAGLAQPPEPADWSGVEAPAFFADAGPGFGGPGGPPPPGGPGRAGPPGFMDPRRLADYLQLSDEQRAAARQLFEGQREKVRPLMEQQRSLREQLETMLDDPAASDAALAGLVKQLHANRQSLEASRQGAKATFAALLDEAQREKLRQLETVLDGLGHGRRHGSGARR